MEAVKTPTIPNSREYHEMWHKNPDLLCVGAQYPDGTMFNIGVTEPTLLPKSDIPTQSRILTVQTPDGVKHISMIQHHSESGRVWAASHFDLTVDLISSGLLYNMQQYDYQPAPSDSIDDCFDTTTADEIHKSAALRHHAINTLGLYRTHLMAIDRAVQLAHPKVPGHAADLTRVSVSVLKEMAVIYRIAHSSHVNVRSSNGMEMLKVIDANAEIGSSVPDWICTESLLHLSEFKNNTRKYANSRPQMGDINVVNIDGTNHLRLGYADGGAGIDHQLLRIMLLDGSSGGKGGGEGTYHALKYVTENSGFIRIRKADVNCVANNYGVKASLTPEGSIHVVNDNKMESNQDDSFGRIRMQSPQAFEMAMYLPLT